MAIVDKDRLEQATRFSAKLVREKGQEYWPVFERLEKELRIRDTQEKKLREFE